ncbi:MAG: PAS domain S-box protein [Fidelibacterota bacterium]
MIKTIFNIKNTNIAELFLNSPIRLFLNLLGLIFIIEESIMFFIVSEVNLFVGLLDATLLTILLAPLLWLYIIRPIRSNAMEERLRAFDVIENTIDGIITIEESGVIKSFNSAAEAIFGYSGDEIIGQKINKLMPSPYSDEHDQYLQSYLETGIKRIIGTGREVSGLRKDGVIIPISIGISEVTLNDRRIFSGIVRDLSAEKKAKEEIRKLSRAMEQSPVSVVITNVEGHIEYVNPKFVKVTGYQPQEVIGKNPRILKSGETPSSEYKNLWDTITAGKEWAGEFHNRKKNGELFWEFASISALRNEDGEITHFIGIKEDITERKATLDALESSEARNTALLNAQPDLMFRIRVDGIILDYHAVEEENLLVAPENFMNQHIKAVLPKWLAEKTLKHMNKAMTSEKLQLFEYNFPVNEKIHCFEARLTKSSEDEITIIIRDITDRKEAEKFQNFNHNLSEATIKTKNLDELYTSIHKIVNDMMPAPNLYISLYDESTETIHFPYFVDEFDSPPSPRKLNKGLTDYVLKTGESLLATPAVFNSLVKKGAIVSRGTSTNNWLGAPLIVEEKTIGVMAIQIYDPNVKYSEDDRRLLTFVSSFVALAIERKRTQQEINHSYQLQDVLNSLLTISLEEISLDEILSRALDIIISVPFITTMPKGGIFLVEDGSNTLSLKVHFGLHESLITVCSNVAFGHCLCGRAAKSGEIEFAQHVDERHDNQYDGILPHGHYNIPIKSHGQVVGVIVLYLNDGHQYRDQEVEFLKIVANTLASIIDRKRIEMEIKKSQQAALEASKAKSRFLANMSHELRTPLNSIIGFTNILLKRGEDISSKKSKTFLERVAVNGKHLLLLINDILDLSKIEAGRTEVVKTEVDLNSLVTEIITQLSGQVVNTNIQILKEIPEKLSPLMTDAGKLKQVLINLVGNAIKFTDEGRVTVAVETETDNHTVSKIRVTDTGIGIPVDKQSTIFDTFQQVESESNRKYQGTGLGLAISKSMCKMMGYDLTVHSEEAKGSTFTIVIQGNGEDSSLISPMRKQRKIPREKNNSQDEIIKKIKGTITYIIDSQSDSRALLKELLLSLECKVSSGQSLRKSVIKKVKPQIIILAAHEISITQKQIAELKEEKTTQSVPIIIVSSKATELSKLLSGANEFVDQPVHRKSLMWALMRCIINKKETS